MKRISLSMIRSWGPCYDPAMKVSEDWSGTVLDVLALDNVSAEDKLWLVLREDLLSAKLLRLFAVSCARDVQHLMTDERSIRAIDAEERYAHGLATDEELRAAWAAAWDAAWDAARDAARDAAWAAAWAAAWDAAWAATRGAAWNAAWVAARGAAWDAAWNAAWAATRGAARAAQVEKLRQMILSMPEEVR